MIRPAKPLRDTVRLLLAALLVLAGLASARMQGHMGAGAAMAATLGGVLCSGETMPVGDAGESPQGHEQHCLLCNLPAADAPPVPVPPARRLVFAPVDYNVDAPRDASERRVSYRSRGPPLFG